MTYIDVPTLVVLADVIQFYTNCFQRPSSLPSQVILGRFFFEKSSPETIFTACFLYSYNYKIPSSLDI